MVMTLRRRSIAAVATAVMVTIPFAVSLPAQAGQPTSSLTVSTTTVQQGQTFTVTQQLYNPQQFTVTGAKAALYGDPAAIVNVADLVSCGDEAIWCGALGSSYRAAVGDMAPGASRSVVFTFRVKDDAPTGQFTLLQQFAGDNYGFETLTGPVLTVTPRDADIGVALSASPQGLLTSTVSYAITVSNSGPAEATGIRVVATYAPGLRFTGSNGCAAVPGTRNVACDIAALAAGTSTSVQFSTATGLLTLGSFT